MRNSCSTAISLRDSCIMSFTRSNQGNQLLGTSGTCACSLLEACPKNWISFSVGRTNCRRVSALAKAIRPSKPNISSMKTPRWMCQMRRQRSLRSTT